MAAPSGRSDRRIRVAFLSTLFHEHIISRVNAGILQHLPRDRFEVLAIHLTDGNADTYVAPFVDRTVRLAYDNVVTVRQQIAALELDILTYADIGMNAFTYLLAFSRLADVQCVLAGHPMTTGVPNIDYFVSTALFEPENAQRYYTEKLVQLQNISVYFLRFPWDRVVLPGTKARLGLAPQTRIYTCPVATFKLHPDFDDAVIRILRQDPDGVFIHMEGHEPHLTPALHFRFQQKAPDVANRVYAMPQLPMSQFLGFMYEADACLDSFYFGAGTTALSAFGIGVPMITLPSPFMRGRVAYGCYQAMDIQDAIAEDADDFVAKALRLAQDKAWRRELEARINQRSDVLFEQLGCVEEFAQFFELALAAKRRGAALIDWPLR